MAHGPCLYEKAFYMSKGLPFLTLLIFSMRPKVQLTPLEVDYQRKYRAKTRARLDELKKPKLIPREKPPAIFSFKPVTFNLPPLTQLVPSCLESNYFPSFAPKDTHLGFERFIGRNPFDLCTNPSTFSYFLPSFSFSLLIETPCHRFCSSSLSLSEICTLCSPPSRSKSKPPLLYLPLQALIFLAIPLLKPIPALLLG